MEFKFLVLPLYPHGLICITKDNTLYINSHCHIQNSQLPASDSISVDYSIAYLDDLSE